MTKENLSGTPAIYEIRLKNYPREGWQEWFEGMSVTSLENGETILSGPVMDQSALHGLLEKLRQFDLILISVKRIDPSS